MSDIDKISLHGEELRQASQRFRHQIDAWQIALPKVEPLFLDFGLGEFDETGLIESWIANEMAAGYCGKYMFLFNGQTCPTHRHKEKIETFFVVKGEVSIHLPDREIKMIPGDTFLVERRLYHSFTAIAGPALLLELSMPCVIADNYFADRRIPLGGNYSGGSAPVGRKNPCCGT